MDLRLICPINYLDFKEEANYEMFEFNNLVLSKDFNILANIFYDDCFYEHIGKINAFEPYGLPFFCRNFIEHENVFDISNDNYKNLAHDVLKSHLYSLYGFLGYLWFIKDNSINTSNFYLYLTEVSFVIYRRMDIVMSTASGEYKTTTFSNDDFVQAKKIFDKMINISSSDFLECQDESNTAILGTQTSNFNKIIFKTQNRIERAKQFLTMARAQSYLPVKIMYYMSILESLFSLNNNEIVRNISNRTSKYLGGNKDKRKATSFYINKAYDVRSRLIHGDSLHDESRQTQQDLIKISVKIDEIIRELLFKVIMEDSELFLVDNEVFGQWLSATYPLPK